MSDGRGGALFFFLFLIGRAVCLPHHSAPARTHLGLARRDGAVHGGEGLGGHRDCGGAGRGGARMERGGAPTGCGKKSAAAEVRPAAPPLSLLSKVHSRAPLHTRHPSTSCSPTPTHPSNGDHRPAPAPSPTHRPRGPGLPGGRGQAAPAADDDVAAGAAGARPERVERGDRLGTPFPSLHAVSRVACVPVCQAGSGAAHGVPGRGRRPGRDSIRRAAACALLGLLSRLSHASLSLTAHAGLPPGRTRGGAQGRREIPADERGACREGRGRAGEERRRRRATRPPPRSLAPPTSTLPSHLSPSSFTNTGRHHGPPAPVHHL